MSSKWLARAGSLLILFGFVLPFLTVSCAAAPGMGTSFSLADLTGQADMPYLYLVPLGAMAALLISFLPVNNRTQALKSSLGQLAGLSAGVISVFISLSSLYSQVGSVGGFKITPQFGLFLLLIGYVVSIYGAAKQWQESSEVPPAPVVPPGRAASFSLPETAPPQPPAAPPPSPSFQVPPRLELVQGSLAQQVVYIESDPFTIGRSSQSDLQISDPQVSRRHVLLRCAQGMWFIQDQGSTAGTLVNGQPVEAIRLQSGDQITIGETVLRFRI